jgi:hypothetical protein
MTIPRIHVKEVNIPNIYLPDWMSRQPNVDHLVPPVVLNIGNPIVDIPGCVKMHKDNQYHNNGLPIDRNLVENDPDQAMIVCDAEVPSYDAMNYEPEQLIITRPQEVPPVAPPPEVEAPEIPDTGDLGKKEDVPCPGPGNLRVGDITQSGDERVVGHKLSEDGKVCETIYEPTTAVEKFIPSTNQATNALAIAVIATAGATATPIILRIVKPILTKIWKTIQKKTGKKIIPPTRAEIISNKYREKKGLPPLKKKN